MLRDSNLPIWHHFIICGAAFAASLLANPAQARDLEHTCLAAPGAEQTATVVFHPTLFGVDGREGDGDVFTDNFEHKFHYKITVTEYDPAKPGWTGPTRCSIEGGWAVDWNIPNLRPEFVVNDPAAIIYLTKVPRHSKVQLHLWVEEDDDGLNDVLDFDPSPNGADVDLAIFVDQGVAQTMVGARNNQNDVTLNSAKRLVGDGNTGSDWDHVRAFIEFVANVHPDNWQSNPVITGPNPPAAIPGMALGTIATINNEPLCRTYALTAVDLTVEAEKLQCGFQPPVWSKDHQTHFDWCMQGANATVAPSQNVQRSADLQTCAAQKAAQPAANLGVCAIYAAEATAAAVTATNYGCGYSGPRWSADYAGHFAWCAAGANPLVMVAETASRSGELAACIASKSGN